MRIATWNCCFGALSKTEPAIHALGADITVVPECRHFPEHPNRLWFGKDPKKKGLAVFASPPFRLRPVATTPLLPSYNIPLQVVGPVSFLLIAVWTKLEPPHQYVRGAVRAIDLLLPMISAQPTIAIGDFNSNTIWDHEHPKDRNHTALVGRFRSLRMTSCYHHLSGEAQGAELTPTYYQYRRVAEPYHIDYCFAPDDWLPTLKTVRVGAPDDWLSLSDHVPLTCDFDTAV